MRTLFKALLLVGSIALHGAVAPVDAQVRGLGRLNGVVLDASGSPVGDVTIETKTMDGVAIKATSSADGKWIVAGLGKGIWEVDFVKDGFVRVKAKVTIATELARTLSTLLMPSTSMMAARAPNPERSLRLMVTSADLHVRHVTGPPARRPAARPD